MGSPWVAFMQDEFKFSLKASAWTFGLVTLLAGLPTVFFYQQGVFDQYDYWAGTVGLVFFALVEAILFAWIWGIDRGWDEINRGSDIVLPKFYKPILKYVTPTILLVIFTMSLVTPKGNDWKSALNDGWKFDSSSIIGQIQNVDITYNREAFADVFVAEVNGIADVQSADGQTVIRLVQPTGEATTYQWDAADAQPVVATGQVVRAGDQIAAGSFVNPIFYKHLARGILVALFAFIAGMVFVAYRRRTNALN
jgi:hypothetical protein